MAKLTQTEIELISAYIDDLSNGEIYKPFSPKDNFCITATQLISALDNLRKELLISSSKSIENYAKVEQEIANVTHDLKTPLAVITGAIECLEDGIDDKDYVQVIKANTTQMNDTVLRIISSSRNMVEEVKKQKRVVNARNYVVKKAPKVLIAVAENEAISVIDNLLTNATKYTQKGKITISFSTTKKWLNLKVKDTGVGISKEDLPNVFNRFYSSDKARQTGGTGIGLNYVKSIVEAHGGSVSVSSRLGKGTTFTITLPRIETKNMHTFTEEQKKCLEASLRLFLFPFFWLYDLGRAIYYGVKHSKNKIDYYLNGEE